MEYRILINTTEGEGKICFNQSCDNNNNFTYLSKNKIYSFSISSNASFYIYTIKNLIYNIKLINEIPTEVIKKLNYQYNPQNIDFNEEDFPLIYFIKDVKYNGININFNFKYKASNNSNNENLNLTIKGYSLDYSEITLYKDKNEYKMYDFQQNETEGKFDNITNSGTIELSKELIQTYYNGIGKYVDDKYFMIIIINNNPFNSEYFKNDMYVFSKDENMILLPINKYIRNSFNLLGNEKITQKYYFEKEHINNNKFILEFSSNYEDKNIELTFKDLEIIGEPKLIGGFKQYILSINQNNINDYYLNLIIKPTNEENALKEVNIVIKYYNEEKKIDTDYICNKEFILEKINNTEKTIDYKLIINNTYEINNSSSNNLKFIYYLRLIKKMNKAINEELNTIAQISSNLTYINKSEITDFEKEFYFNLNNLEYNEKYIISFFIKLENENEEKYYSITYEFSSELDKKQNTTIILIVIIVIILVIICILFFIIWWKISYKNKNLEFLNDRTYFSTEISEDIINDSSGNCKNDKNYELYFV